MYFEAKELLFVFFFFGGGGVGADKFVHVKPQKIEKWLLHKQLWFRLLNPNGSCQLLPRTSSLSTG